MLLVADSSFPNRRNQADQDGTPSVSEIFSGPKGGQKRKRPKPHGAVCNKSTDPEKSPSGPESVSGGSSACQISSTSTRKSNGDLRSPGSKTQPSRYSQADPDLESDLYNESLPEDDYSYVKAQDHCPCDHHNQLRAIQQTKKHLKKPQHQVWPLIIFFGRFLQVKTSTKLQHNCTNIDSDWGKFFFEVKGFAF